MLCVNVSACSTSSVTRRVVLGVRSVDPPPPASRLDWRLRSAKDEGARARSGNEDDLAEGAGLHDLFLSANDFAERNLLAHHGTKRAVLQAGENRGVDFLRCGFGDATQRGAVERRAARPQILRRE